MKFLYENIKSLDFAVYWKVYIISRNGMGSLILQRKEVKAMEPLERFSLCIACEACPVVEIYEDEIRIGEEGNLARLKKEEWNRLVEMIKKGELKEI